MTAFLRNTLLAAVAVSGFAGSAMAKEIVPSCAYSSLNDLWSGRCCNLNDSNCLGGGNGGRDHGDKGGSSTNGGNNSPAGKP